MTSVAGIASGGGAQNRVKDYYTSVIMLAGVASPIKVVAAMTAD